MPLEQVTITDSSFDPEAIHRDFRTGMDDTGAIVAFTGVVRGEGDVTTLTLSHYPGFTESEIARIGSDAESRWSLTGWHVIHRVGEMKPGEAIVMVLTASAHRRDAFEAADYIMDFLKSEAPFWKQETRGPITEWIEPRVQDKTDIKRWNKHGRN